jgi:YebC/PmpR family DNA-binding regulatory protein
MPADNIKRAIQKGTGELEGASYEEMVLEGYGPGGVAILVEGTSDNRNRTVSEIRHMFTKNGGNLGTVGSVSYMFKPRGYISIATSKIDEEKLMEIALEAGAEDIQTSGDLFEVYTAPNVHDAVVQAIKKAGVEPEEAEIGKYAENNITLEGPKAQSDAEADGTLEDQDDVQNVWANSTSPRRRWRPPPRAGALLDPPTAERDGAARAARGVSGERERPSGCAGYPLR